MKTFSKLDVKQIFTAFCLFFGVTMHAQNFTEQTGTNNPFDGFNIGTHSSPTFVDINGDGHLDLFSGTQNGFFRYYKNNGNNVFTLQTGTDNPFAGFNGGGYSYPDFADLDEDGDLDLISGRDDGTFKYYQNDGNNNFTELTGVNNPLTGIDTGNFSTPTFADLDNDGDLDLVSGGLDGELKYYQNNGNLTFTHLAGTNNPLEDYNPAPFATTYSKPNFADLDKDGDLDLITGELFGTFRYYRNDGNNNYTQLFATNNPLNILTVELGGQRDYTSPTLVDIDNDGNLDVVYGASNGNFYYYKNVSTLSTQSENLVNTQLSLFPNPASTNLKIELNSTIKTVEVYNLLGKKMNINNFDNSQINILRLSRGIYVLKIVDENGSVLTKRFVKK